jgi:hypothetical protein
MRLLASFGHPVQVIRHGPKKIQYRPGLIEAASPEQSWHWNRVKHLRTSN